MISFAVSVFRSSHSSSSSSVFAIYSHALNGNISVDTPSNVNFMHRALGILDWRSVGRLLFLPALLWSAQVHSTCRGQNKGRTSRSWLCRKCRVGVEETGNKKSRTSSLCVLNFLSGSFFLDSIKQMMLVMVGGALVNTGRVQLSMLTVA